MILVSLSWFPEEAPCYKYEQVQNQQDYSELN